MRYHTLNGLLTRPQPLIVQGEAEALSSWIYRLAVANGFETYGQLFANARVKISCRASLDSLSERLGVLRSLRELSLYPEERLEQHTLQEDLQALSGDGSVTNGRWVLTANAGLVDRGGGRYAVCVDCLESDRTPYWRRSWRLSTTTICHRHGKMLVEACPSCGAPFMLWGRRSAPLDQCGLCWQRLQPTSPLPGSIETQSWRWSAPSAAIASQFPVALGYSHLWWDGIRVLLNVFSRPKLAKKLQCLPCSRLITSTLEDLAGQPRADFDRQPVAVRHELLNLCQWLVADWPSRFVRSMNEAGITWTEFSTCEIEMPYWLWSVCKVELDRRRYQVTEGEVKAAAALIARNGGAASKIAVKRMLGVTEGQALDISHPMKRQALADSELVRIFQVLDQDLIEAPSSRDMQATLLRDACCFAVSAWLSISFKKASALALSDGQEMVETWLEAAAEDSEKGVLAKLSLKWMELYLGGTRAKFERLNPPQTALFISRFGLPTNGFALAARFASLLRRCEIDGWERGARLLVGRQQTRTLLLSTEPI